MRTYLSAEFSRVERRPHGLIYRIIQFILTYLLVGQMLPGSHSIPTRTTTLQDKSHNRTFLGVKVDAEKSINHKYDCSGGLRLHSKQGEDYLERAIDDALSILGTCETCRLMFSRNDPGYAIALLKRLKRDKSFVISARMPTQWTFSSSYKLRVKSSEGFGDAGAAYRDLSNSKKFQMPCIYINVTGFIVTGEQAEGYGLFGLEPSVQRAVAILHELGHVANVIQIDGSETEELRKKSVANTNCIRRNCISCKEFKACLFAEKVSNTRASSTSVHSSIQRLGQTVPCFESQE